MSCEICGRGSCTRSFHRIEEQEAHDELAAMDAYELRRLVINLREDNEDLKNQINELEAANV